MRERVVSITLKEHQLALQNAKALMRAKLVDALKIDEIDKAHKAYSNACFEDMMKGVENSQNSQKAHLNYTKALVKHGFCENDFEYKPLCNKCIDLGAVDGKVCSCVWDKYIANLKKECEIDARAKFSFDDCNLSIIKDKTQRANLEKLYSLMRTYVEKYPSVKSNTIVISGGVGVGKTCLASAISRGIVEKGFAVKIMSAYEFVSLMLKAHTSPIAERAGLMHDVLTCDMLLIDDLGTEPILKNVTVEYLLLVIEERQNANKTTLITTNLAGNNLLSRYGERIYSRLHHKQISLVFDVNGKDLRQTK